MPISLDLTFHPYTATHDGALWHGIPETATSTLPAWQWSPALKLVMDGDLDTINQLLGNGWERLTGPGGAEHWTSDQGPHAINGPRYLKLVSQLTDVRLLQMGDAGDYELWARTADLQRAASLPVTLAFARHGLAEDDFPRGVVTVNESGLTMLRVAQMLPPPQFGEIALVDHTLDDGQRIWQVYTLAALGDEGLALWERMGRALAALASPGEWWPYTPQLAACLRGDYPRIREALKERRADAKGIDRTRVYALMRQLALDMKHATALETARRRAQSDPASWLAQWEEIRQMAAELAALYWAAHLAATAIPATADETEPEPEPATAIGPVAEVPQMPEEAALLAQIVESNAPAMDTTNYPEDQAIRRAILSQPSQWTTEADETGNDTAVYAASPNLAVYYKGTRENPLTLAEAQAQLLEKRPRAVIRTRIAMGLWAMRRTDPKLGKNGQSLMTYDEILHYSGVPKHSRLAHPDTGSEQRRTDGYRTEDRESVRRDLELASRFYLHGKVYIRHKGKILETQVSGYYMNVTFISVPDLWGGYQHTGAWVGPGGWINAHTEMENYFLAEVDRRIFELDPHHQQHELKIGLYLTELWREQAHDGRYADPITMAELLQQSVIDVDYKHLTDRFSERIEQAITTLQARGIASFECLNPPDKSKAHWGKDWLAARWRIVPPEALRQSYIDKGITQTAAQLPPGRPGQPKNGKTGKRGGNGTGQKG